MLIKARYVVPVDGPVIANGGVTFEDGLITAIGPAAKLSNKSTTDYGNAVICPGFVNAHTHLELSSCAGLIPPAPDFADWLRRLINVARDTLATREAVDASIMAGIDQSLRAGVTLVGDITSRPDLTRPFLAKSTLRSVSFGEVIATGTLRGRVDERLAAALCKDGQTETFRIGMSPHAPYTVEPAQLRHCAARAEQAEVPLAIHLAETEEETEFTRNCSGPLAEHLQSLGVWDNLIPIAQCSPVELANRSGLLGSKTIIAHGNYVTDFEIDIIARAGTSVAYCPQTHDAFEHKPHRFRDMLAAGVNVCVGTDSLASNPTLSVLEELRFLRRNHPDVDPMELLRMGTMRGANALGFGERSGSIAQGKQADLCVVPLPNSAKRTKWESILDSQDGPAAVYISGVPLSE